MIKMLNDSLKPHQPTARPLVNVTSGRYYHDKSGQFSRNLGLFKINLSLTSFGHCAMESTYRKFRFSKRLKD